MSDSTPFREALAWYAKAYRLDPSDVAVLVDLAALGLVDVTQRGGPMEQALTFGILTDAKVFQICAVFGAHAQAVLAEHLSPVVHSIGDLERLDIDRLLAAATSIAGACSNPRSQVPGGTLGDLLGGAIPALVDHAKMGVALLMSEMVNEGGAGAALVRRASHAVARCGHWPGTPWWSAIVNASARALAATGKTGEAERFAPVKERLRSTPATLDTQTLSWVLHSRWFGTALVEVLTKQVYRPQQPRR